MKLTPGNFLTHIKNLVTGGGRMTSGVPHHDAGYLKRAEGVTLASINPANAGLGMSQIVFPVGDMSIATGAGLGATTAGDVVTDFHPGYRFKLIALDFVTGSLVGAGASASAPCNLAIGATDVTGGVVTVTLASTNTIGELTAGAAITALNIGSASDVFSIEKATSVVFTAGEGAFVVTIQNLDLVDALTGTADETNALVSKVPAAVDTIGNVVFPVPRDYDEATDELTLRVLASQLTSSTDNDVELDSEMYIKTAGSSLGADVNPTAPGTVLTAAEQWVEIDLTGNSLTRDQVATIKLITNGANDTAGEEVLIHAVELVYRSCLVSYDEVDGTTPLR